MKKKNILLITSDQQRADTIGMINSKIKTPNLDKLVEDGILFERGYTCNPVCTPSRITMLTGHYPSRHGCYTIGTSLPTDYETVPQILKENGYFTSLIGKAHFQPCLYEKSFESKPNIDDMEYFKNWSGDFYGFEYAKLVIGHACEAHSSGMHYGVWLKDKGVDVNQYFGTHKYFEFGSWNLPDELSSGQWTFEETSAAIDKAVEQDKPFYIWSSFQNPHNPCYVPEPWASMYDDEDVDTFDYVEGEYDDKPDLYRNIHNHSFVGTPSNHKYGEDVYCGEKDWHCISGMQDVYKTKEEKKQITRIYYGMVSQMDHYIGKIIDYLKEKNIYDDTVIIFTSDHGEYLGNHGLWWKGLPAYEDVQNVPFIVKHPDCKTKGAKSQSLQSLIDIPTTALSIANVELPFAQQGVVEEMSWIDKDASCRDKCLIEFRPTESPFMQTTLVTQDYKLVVYADREYGELYNLKNDKNQYKNLWNEQVYSEVKTNMMMKLYSAQMNKDGVLRTRFSPA